MRGFVHMFAFLFGSEQPGIVPQKALLLKMANAERKTSRGKSQQYELRPGFGHKLTPVFSLSIDVTGGVVNEFSVLCNTCPFFFVFINERG